jgi:hypothetical protein
MDYRAGAWYPRRTSRWRDWPLFITQGDVLVFVDADLTQWGPHFYERPPARTALAPGRGGLLGTAT